MAHPIRVIVLAAALLVALGALGWRAAQHDVRPTPSAPEPWVPMPRTGMDASRREMRATLRTDIDVGGVTPLSSTCGYRDEGAPDRYRLVLTKDRYFSEVRRIDVVVESPDRIVVSVQAINPVSGGEGPKAPVGTSTMTWKAVEPLRRAWRDSPIWNRPQRSECTHSRWLSMEACIDRAYALRMAVCETDTREAYDALWEVVTTTLPPPPDPPWELRPPPKPGMH